MNNIDNITDYFLSSRNSGHTTLTIEGAKYYQNKFLIIAHSINYAYEIYEKIGNSNGIPVSYSSNLSKYRNLPAIVDNSAQIYIFKEMLNKISNMEMEISKTNSKIKNLKLSYKIKIENLNKIIFSKGFEISKLKNLSLFKRIFKYSKNFE